MIHLTSVHTLPDVLQVFYWIFAQDMRLSEITYNQTMSITSNLLVKITYNQSASSGFYLNVIKCGNEEWHCNESQYSILWKETVSISHEVCAQFSFTLFAVVLSSVLSEFM